MSKLIYNKNLETTNGFLQVENSPAHGPHLDGFGRQRVATLLQLFENKNIFSENEDKMLTEKSGVGTSIAHLPNESTVQLNVGTVSGEYTIRQSRRYHTYIPARTQLIIMTGVLGASKTNTTRRIGLFDDDDGLFFELADSTLSVVRRTSTSGSVVNNVINQSLWNVDKMDGTGPSKITLDTSKTQIFVIDFQWLGSGRVRMGFNIDGETQYCHEYNNSNKFDTVYMKRPTLPLRYELRNTGTSASASSMKEICSTVSSEGADKVFGVEFAKSNETVTVAVTVLRPIFAIRLKNTFQGVANRRTVKLNTGTFYAGGNDACFAINHVNDPTAITATWSDVDAHSSVEYSTDISAITGDDHTLQILFASGGGKANSEKLTIENDHSYINQNYDSSNSQVFVICADSFTGTADVSAALSWIEYD